MPPPADLRVWIELLEREGELVRVGAEVDPDLEITEIVDRTVKSGGPALLGRGELDEARAALRDRADAEPLAHAARAAAGAEAVERALRAHRSRVG